MQFDIKDFSELALALLYNSRILDEGVKWVSGRMGLVITSASMVDIVLSTNEIMTNQIRSS
ncbi:MAG: hypothetical protein BA871_15965 [Desulfuromonadales bacterium C00003096]|nr:MAG: hypothetical protein BA871_15965 [Desulfuromonadales bacterium C00003096]